jgi:hypothetical protein
MNRAGMALSRCRGFTSISLRVRVALVAALTRFGKLPTVEGDVTPHAGRTANDLDPTRTAVGATTNGSIWPPGRVGQTAPFADPSCLEENLTACTLGGDTTAMRQQTKLAGGREGGYGPRLWPGDPQGELLGPDLSWDAEGIRR